MRGSRPEIGGRHQERAGDGDSQGGAQLADRRLRTGGGAREAWGTSPSITFVTRADAIQPEAVERQRDDEAVGRAPVWPAAA